ncbi:TolC family protein [Tahibacter harae]|uniref:TolC family protein n=1 Tax=Tahibacter harae TaxID=2963937 RepID=A0ABT1QM91_9GAMM|nr:TolC family protein [Tahibacter harae]MCQ4163633.1 TolC family protein [Tahibacter harae]
MQTRYLPLPLAAALALLSGCVAVSRREGAANVEQLLQPRLSTPFQWRADPSAAVIDARAAELLAQPLTPLSAFQLAQLRNPAIASHYAELGIAQAAVVEASRIGNPGFSIASSKEQGPAKITTGVSLPLSDLLLLSSRRQFAAGEYERSQLLIAQALFDLAADTASDWYAAAGAEQVAAMRAAVAEAADASAELARRFHDAGNISALQLKLEQAAASQARIAAAAARAEAQRARLALNTRMGLSGAEAARWRLDLPLLAPVETEDEAAGLLALAQQQRLDLAAARRDVELLDQALKLVRRWRLLGNVEVGYEREKESDGSRSRGPTLTLAIPLFNQGQAAIARAEAQLEQGRASLAQLQLGVDNAVRLGVEQVAAQRAIVADYRDALVPQREAVVQRELERFNYMLIGAFELLLARQQEYDAYQGYLLAVRDYWQARVELARAVGAELPSTAAARTRALGVESVLQPAAGAGSGHGGHGNHGQINDKAQDHSAHGKPQQDGAGGGHAGRGTQEPADGKSQDAGDHSAHQGQSGESQDHSTHQMRSHESQDHSAHQKQSGTAQDHSKHRDGQDDEAGNGHEGHGDHGKQPLPANPAGPRNESTGSSHENHSGHSNRNSDGNDAGHGDHSSRQNTGNKKPEAADDHSQHHNHGDHNAAQPPHGAQP